MIRTTYPPSTQSLGEPLTWRYNPALGVTVALGVSPTTINTAAVTTVTFTGSGTTWTGTPPTFTPTGVAGVSTASLNVLTDTSATLVVTTLGTTGTITWDDSTTGATATQIVQFAGLQHVNVVRLAQQYYLPDFI